MRDSGWTLRITFSAVLLSMSACGSPTPESADSFLCRRDSSGRTIYAIGTVHHYQKGGDRQRVLGALTRRVIRDSQIVVIEAVASYQQDVQQLQAATREAAVDSLYFRKDLVERYASWEVGLPSAFRPTKSLLTGPAIMAGRSLVEIELNRRRGQSDPVDVLLLRGDDYQLISMSRGLGKVVVGLESSAEFAEMTARLGALRSENNRMLEAALDFADCPKCLRPSLAVLDNDSVPIADAFLGRYEAVYRMARDRYVQSGLVDYWRIQVEDRGRAWVPRLKVLMEQRSSALVAVGAAHIGGPNGLLAAFESLGYKQICELPRL